MSLSDYISIFDTRPIAQSHLTGAATATLCRHTTQQHNGEPNALRSERERVVEHERDVARLATALGRTAPRRATPRRAELRATPRYARPSRPLSLSLSLHAVMLTRMFQRSHHRPPLLRCTFIEHTYARRCTTRSGVGLASGRLPPFSRDARNRCSSARNNRETTRSGPRSGWNARA